MITNTFINKYLCIKTYSPSKSPPHKISATFQFTLSLGWQGAVPLMARLMCCLLQVTEGRKVLATEELSQDGELPGQSKALHGE